METWRPQLYTSSVKISHIQSSYTKLLVCLSTCNRPCPVKLVGLDCKQGMPETTQNPDYAGVLVRLDVFAVKNFHQNDASNFQNF